MSSVLEIQKKSRIRVVDDEISFLEAVQELLTYKGWKVSAYTNANEFLTNDRYSEPGCLLLDLRMPGMTGLQLQEFMKKRQIKLPVIFLSAHGDIDTAVTTLERGAFTFLQKSCDSSRLLSYIEKACRISLENLPLHDFLTPQNAAEMTKCLSEREKNVLKLVGLGLSSSLIGQRLNISPRTVDAHRASVAKKLGVHSTQEVLSILSLADPSSE